MPKIVRNEIDYSSTTSTANQISYLNNTSGLSATNVQDAIDEIVSVEDITNQFTWNETVVDTGTGAYKFGNMIFITYQGENKTHAALDVLFVVPSGLRPPKNWRIPFTVNALTYGNLVINATGNCIINQISDSTQSGRIYFSIAYPIA